MSKRSVTNTFFRFFRDRNAVLHNITKQRWNQETESKSEQNVVVFEIRNFCSNDTLVTYDIRLSKCAFRGFLVGSGHQLHMLG
jgi:hypothetical protein